MTIERIRMVEVKPFKFVERREVVLANVSDAEGRAYLARIGAEPQANPRNGVQRWARGGGEAYRVTL